MDTVAVQKEFVFIQMYIYESEEQVANMNKDFQIVMDIFAPVNVIAEQGVLTGKESTNTTRVSKRIHQYNILPNTTPPIVGAYRINTVVVPYNSTNDEDIRKVNLLIRKLGYIGEWIMFGDAEDVEKEYNIVPNTLRTTIYPYQLWMWMKYIQEKRDLLASVSSNSERASVQKAIDSALQNIKDIYVDPIYPQCTETIRTMIQTTPEEKYGGLTTDLGAHFSACYKDYLLQVYIAIKAKGLGRKSKEIINMVKTMYEELGMPSANLMDLVQSRREVAGLQRFPEPSTEPRDPLNSLPQPSYNNVMASTFQHNNTMHGRERWNSLGGGSAKKHRRTHRMAKKHRGTRKSRRHQ
jgi:hypothetical protein